MLYRIPECSFHPGKIFWMLYWFSNCQCLIHFSFNEINFISSKLLNFVDSNNGEESPLVPPSSLVKGKEKWRYKQIEYTLYKLRIRVNHVLNQPFIFKSEVNVWNPFNVDTTVFAISTFIHLDIVSHVYLWKKEIAKIWD